MDSEILVAPNLAAARALVPLLDEAQISPRAVLWVHDTDRSNWRLWIVPKAGLEDKREFYRRVSEVISRHRDQLEGLDVGETEFVKPDHPAIQGLSKLVKAEGLSEIRMSNNMLNGFYLPDSIVLRMNVT